jgi:allophanate hydrolase
LSEFLEEHSEHVFPVTGVILQDASRFSAVETIKSIYRLAELKRATERIWEKIDVLALPTAGTTYTIREVESEPITLNTNLGYFTNFTNLLDLCAVAVPHSFQSSGLPFGISLHAPAWRDAATLAIADRLHRMKSPPMGATRVTVPVTSSDEDFTPVAVVGAHLRGQPLNFQLTNLEARFVRQCRTAPEYRLYALNGTVPAKPGMVRVAEGGCAIELEVWELPRASFSSFAEGIPFPLLLGTVLLESGEIVRGFLCEPVATAEAEDISASGGWRAYLGALS